MSTLAVNTITNAAGGNTATINGMTPTADSLQGFRNRIINGDMRIDQRNAGASVTPASGQYLVDRFVYGASQASKFTAQQNAGAVTAPSGFTNYLGLTVASAVAVGVSDRFRLMQAIEGLNVSDLGWGTANAQAVTLSFWVRSSLTGSFGGAVGNSAGNRSYPFPFTVSSANTWEQKTVTIPGDTTGTWLTTNGLGILLQFNLGAGSNFLGTANTWAAADYVAPTGSTSVVGTNGATFYITGVQLEAGSVATPFERRDYGRELMMCQRYFEVLVASGSGITLFPETASFARNSYPFKVTKRAVPTIAGGSGAAEGGGTWTPAYQVSGVETWNISAFYGTSLARPALNGPVTASIEL
jgi:hypothetical protein